MNYVKKKLTDYMWKEMKKNLFEGWGEAATDTWEVARDTVSDQVRDWQKKYWDAEPQAVTDARRRGAAAAERFGGGNARDEIELQANERYEPPELPGADPYGLEKTVASAMYDDEETFGGQIGARDLNDPEELQDVLEQFKDAEWRDEMKQAHVEDAPFERQGDTWLERQETFVDSYEYANNPDMDVNWGGIEMQETRGGSRGIDAAFPEDVGADSRRFAGDLDNAFGRTPMSQEQIQEVYGTTPEDFVADMEEFGLPGDIEMLPIEPNAVKPVPDWFKGAQADLEAVVGRKLRNYDGGRTQRVPPHSRKRRSRRGWSRRRPCPGRRGFGRWGECRHGGNCRGWPALVG